MSKFAVTIEDAFQVGIDQGRKEMLQVVKQLATTCYDLKQFSVILTAFETGPQSREILKRLLSEAAGASTTKSGPENKV